MPLQHKGQLLRTHCSVFHYDATDHGVWRSVTPRLYCQPQGLPHVPYVQILSACAQNHALSVLASCNQVRALLELVCTSFALAESVHHYLHQRFSGRYKQGAEIRAQIFPVRLVRLANKCITPPKRLRTKACTLDHAERHCFGLRSETAQLHVSEHTGRLNRGYCNASTCSFDHSR